MRTLTRFLPAFSLLFILSAVVWAGNPGISTEIITDVQGQLVARTVTPVGQMQTGEIGPVAPPLTDQETLWMTEDPIAIANNVDISGNGTTIVTGWYLNSMRTSKYATQGTGAPIWEYSQAVNFYLPVSSSDDASVIASTGSQVPLRVWLSGAGPNPSWQYTNPSGYDGVDVDVSDNGAYIATICKQTGTGTQGKLIVFNASSATPLWTIDFVAGNQANGVEISENNEWIVVGCYYDIYVYQVSTQSLFYTGTNYSQTPPGINADAEYLATGDFNGVLHLFRRVGSTYTQQWQNTLGGWVTAVDISSDASKVLAGNYSYSPVNAGLVRAFSITGTPLWSYNQYGDYVDAVALCNDGSVGVAASWGQLNATFGDVFTAFNVATGAVIYHLLDDIDEPGSLFDAAISDDGAFATAGGKAVHARTFGNGGETYSLQLGLAGPNVTIILLPVSPPIIIPATGGSFNYNANLTNSETAAQTFDAWIMVQLPSGSYYGPVLGPINLTLQGGASITRVRTQNVPASAPSGDYDYIGYVGTYNTAIWDSSSFNFQKQASGDGPLISGWDNTGSAFVAAASQPLACSIRPNPFNPTTAIRYQILDARNVSLQVFDTAGRLVARLVDGWQEAGDHEVTFDGSALTSGVYLYRLQAGVMTSAGKMMLVK